MQIALWHRKPALELIDYCGQGVQYTFLSFAKRLEEVSIVTSIGRIGSALDNTISERFVVTLKLELVSRAQFPSL